MSVTEKNDSTVGKRISSYGMNTIRDANTFYDVVDGLRILLS